MTRPLFSKERITRYAEHALNKASARLTEGVPVDWQDLVSRFTMDSATEFLFGKDVRSLDAPIPYPSSHPLHSVSREVHPADRFVRAFQDGLEATAIRGRYLQSWPLFEFWGDRVKRHLEAVDEFIDPIVEDAVRKSKGSEKMQVGNDDEEGDVEKSGKDSVKDGESLLDHLVKFTDGAYSRLSLCTHVVIHDPYTYTDHKVIKDETLNILLAGRDTTACTLTFAVYNLAENPNVFKRLREEVMSAVGPTRRPTYEDIRNMKYLRAVINGEPPIRT